MASEREVLAFVRSQKSIQFYRNVQQALAKVLKSMPDQDYRKATKNLILMVLHEGSLGQVMHFPKSSEFKVLQLDVPNKIPYKVLVWVIAHELGHVMQGRNWRPGDKDSLETDASKRASEWGFKKTPEIGAWINRYRKQRLDKLHKYKK